MSKKFLTTIITTVWVISMLLLEVVAIIGDKLPYHMGQVALISTASGLVGAAMYALFMFRINLFATDEQSSHQRLPHAEELKLDEALGIRAINIRIPIEVYDVYQATATNYSISTVALFRHTLMNVSMEQVDDVAAKIAHGEI